MIARITVDNYRCFSRFTVEPSHTTLILGANGSGKSSLFDAVFGIIGLVVHGHSVGECFPTDSLTRWDMRSEQRFELCFQDGDVSYCYELLLTHDRKHDTASILRESVTRDGVPIFRSQQGSVQLYANSGEPGTTFAYTGSRSFLAMLDPPEDMSDLQRLLALLSGLWVLKLDPNTMVATSATEQSSLTRDGANFASWYRHWQQEEPARVSRYFELLGDALPGFQQLKLHRISPKVRELVVCFQHERESYTVSFEQLSDGQRVLIVLYALLLNLDGEPRTLLFDEPGNYLALPEVQPWLFELGDALGDAGQILVASHSPEVIDHLAAEHAIWFERERGGPVRSWESVFDRDSGLRASEQISRGLLAFEPSGIEP